MKQLGISVYPDLRPFAEIESYIQLASKYNVKRIFSSMFSVKGSNEEIINYFTQLINCAHQYDIVVELDVNHEFLDKIGVKPDDLSLFNKMHLDVLRMDVPYGDNRDIDLCNNPYNIIIEFNASMKDFTHMEYILRYVDNAKIIMGHNFYPQRYTGMKWQKFIDINNQIKQLNLDINAFISSNNKNTHGVWDAKDGLCTVEMMRGLPIDLQARYLSLTYVDNIFIGNAYASEEEFKQLNNELNTKGTIVKVELEKDITQEEKEILLDYSQHMDMGDSSEWIWRSRMPRIIYKDYDIIPRKFNNEYFEVGDVVIVNDNYKHYAAEIQVVLQPIINDGTRNLIGHINKEEMVIFDLLKEKDIVIFRNEL